MQASQKAYEIIKQYEGLRLTAYLCEAKKWTIGYGSTSGVTKGMTITQEEAEYRLSNDIAATEIGLKMLITGDLKQNEFDALVSWAFNVGLTKAATSTLIRKLNKGEPGVSNQFLRWDKVRKGPGGALVVSFGLARRRLAEKKLYDGEIPLSSYS